MKRAMRPVPILVPPEEPPRDFKLTDSGVFEQGGIVVSKAGCIIKSATAQPDAGLSQTGASKQDHPDGSCCSSSRPASRTSTPAANVAAGTGTCSTPATTAAAAAAASGLGADAQRSTAAVSAAATPASGKDAGAGTGSSSATSSPSSSRQGSSQSGIALDDLQEVTVIGRGSSGVVKKVLHKPSGGIYVLKVINFDMGCEQVRRQVTTEVRAMDGARHPHIVSYHQSYFANGAMTILMEFMDGGSLWDVLQRHQSIPGRYLPELARQVLLGLSHLHGAARICHRDIKPSNLLLSSSGQLKISDFGVSSQLSNSMSKCLSWVGTVTYMSPERIQGHSYGFNTDVWSLGLLLLECAVGRYPYPPQGEGGSEQQQQRLGFWELLEYIVVEPAPKLPGSQFSRELVDFVGQCLQKDAARRPSAAEMLAHPFIMQGPRANLSELLAPAPARGKAKAAAAAAAGASAAGRAAGAAAGGGMSSSTSSRRSISAGSTSGVAAAAAAAAASGSSRPAVQPRAGVPVVSRSSSVRASSAPGASAVGVTSASTAALVGPRHSTAAVGQLAPYTSSYQLRPASSAVVKVCTPTKQQQPSQQQQQQQQRQAQPSLRQQMHPDLQQHLLSRMQVSQPMVAHHSPGQLAAAQQQRQQQGIQQQQQQQQRPSGQQQQQPQLRVVSQQPQQQQQQQQQARSPGQSGQQQQHPQQLHQQESQGQHRVLGQPASQSQQQQQQQSPQPSSSGPLTARKPTPRKPPVRPPSAVPFPQNVGVA